jgi:streptogramin lyase
MADVLLLAQAIVATVAGTGDPADLGDPFGVEIGPDGALYVTEVRRHRVRRVDLKSGASSFVAGCGVKGYDGDGGPAAEAQLNEPYEIRFEPDGTFYFVEMQNHVVRRVDGKTRAISTVAGTGRAGFGGDGGPARRAQLTQPHSVALDGRGGLYIADIGNHRIRRVDLKAGTIETAAGDGRKELPRDGGRARGAPMLGPRALFIEGRTLWIALREGHSVWKLDLDSDLLRRAAGTGKKGYTGDGGPALEATFNGPKGIAVAPDGAVVVVDTENHAIRRIDPKTGAISTVPAGALSRPHGICVGGDGAIYIGDTLNHRVQRVR